MEHVFKILLVSNSSVNYYVYRFKCHLSNRDIEFRCCVSQTFEKALKPTHPRNTEHMKVDASQLDVSMQQQNNTCGV